MWLTSPVLASWKSLHKTYVQVISRMSTDSLSLSVFESRSLLKTANDKKRYVIQHCDNAITILVVVLRNIYLPSIYELLCFGKSWKAQFLLKLQNRNPQTPSSTFFVCFFQIEFIDQLNMICILKLKVIIILINVRNSEQLKTASHAAIGLVIYFDTRTTLTWRKQIAILCYYLLNTIFNNLKYN